MSRFSQRTVAVLAAAAAVATPARALAGKVPAKNVIYMVADGAGYSAYEATGYFNGDEGNTVVNGPGWSGFAMSTYPLRTGNTPGSNDQDPTTVYRSSEAWNTTRLQPPVDVGSPASPRLMEFAGYEWVDRTAPDSANTISASMTGKKTYNNAVNVDGAGNDQDTFPELMARLGKRTGVVSTVQFSDATPAAFSGVSNTARANRTQIADQMLNSQYIDVIIGAGNPDFDNNGQPNATPNQAWVSEGTWADLKDGDTTGLSAQWQLIQDKSEFEALADGTLAPTKKVVGVIKSFDGKQQYRGPDGLVESYAEAPGSVPFRTDVPDLTTMVHGAVNVLVDDPEGFFLGVEQGEVDRAEHANNLGRTIEAQTEFLDTVADVEQMLLDNAGDDSKPNFDNTLLIVTADHDHQLYGPDGDTVPFDEIVDNGEGNLPGAKFQTNSHSNHLVPLFAKGAGSELIAQYADQEDFFTDGELTFGRGAYLDQAELHDVFVGATAIPLPGAVFMAPLAMTIGGLAYRRMLRQSTK